jgi:hypothetical protein
MNKDEGISYSNGASYNYEYNLRGHPGKIWVAFIFKSDVWSLVQINDYYPFGMLSSRNS